MSVAAPGTEHASYFGARDVFQLVGASNSTVCRTRRLPFGTFQSRALDVIKGPLHAPTRTCELGPVAGEGARCALLAPRAARPGETAAPVAPRSALSAPGNMSRRATPPPDADGLLDSDGEVGRMAAGSGSDKVRVPTAIKFVLQLMIQHAHSHTSVLDMLDLSGVSWKSNPGSAVEALLRRAGLDWSADGKRLWRVSDDTVVIEWSPSAAPKTLRPASRASTAPPHARRCRRLDLSTTQALQRSLGERRSSAQQRLRSSCRRARLRRMRALPRQSLAMRASNVTTTCAPSAVMR